MAGNSERLPPTQDRGPTLIEDDKTSVSPVKSEPPIDDFKVQPVKCSL